MTTAIFVKRLSFVTLMIILDIVKPKSWHLWRQRVTLKSLCNPLLCLDRPLSLAPTSSVWLVCGQCTQEHFSDFLYLRAFCIQSECSELTADMIWLIDWQRNSNLRVFSLKLLPDFKAICIRCKIYFAFLVCMLVLGAYNDLNKNGFVKNCHPQNTS